MKRTILSALLGLLLTLSLGATAVTAAGQSPDCIWITVGDGVNFDICTPGDGMPPPHLVIEHPDGRIIQPTN